jgi:YYY domain-containing protein
LLPVLLWWAIIEILGLAALPLAQRLFRWLPDFGYAFSKALGLLVVSYVLWMGAMTGVLQNDLGGILFAIFLLVGVSTWLYFKGQGPDQVPLQTHIANFFRTRGWYILTIELLFASAFILWAILRAYAPDKIMSAGGEKFMEIAFLNGILKSPGFPPLDPWLSGFAISYYYFGYVMMALLTRFSGVSSAVGFELYDALLFALVVSSVFGIAYNLVKAAQGSHRIEREGQAIRYGLLASLLVTVMGNLEGLIEVFHNRGILPESLLRWLDIPGLISSPPSGGWMPAGGFFGCCWRASRVIQEYDPLGNALGVSPITEFPMFSFLLGDNHPHVLALPFVLLIIALAFNLLRRQSTLSAEQQQIMAAAPWWNPARTALAGDWAMLVAYAFCLGSLGFLNTWDMPIYWGLLLLAYAAGEAIRAQRFDWYIIRRTISLGISLLAGAIIFYLFFYIGFSSQAGGVLPYVNSSTRLVQYLLIFAAFILPISWFLVIFLKKESQGISTRTTFRMWLSSWGWVIAVCLSLVVIFLITALLTDLGQTLLGNQPGNSAIQTLLGGFSLGQLTQKVLINRLSNPWLFILLTSLIGLTITNGIIKIRQPSIEEKPAERKDSSIFVILLILLGLVLTLSTELFYLRDIFMVRMNTVFKFYFQAWILLGISSAYAIWWIMNRSQEVMNNVWRTIFAACCILLITSGLVFSLVGFYLRVDGFRQTPNLDGTANLARFNPDDWAAINWLNENVTGTPIILEAPGKSYNYEGRISAFTGLPSLLGWALHENQWRGSYDEQAIREPDIQTIFTSKDAVLALELLQKWDIRYVIVGPSEKNFIQQICSDPNRACNLSRALQKFDLQLEPVFQQGETTIYRVPEIME